ncbi:MAG: hypothetical protein QOG72_333 [Sphingomonadales bacterium]|jgi:outer membrane protein OmpA-like peptidoglycan-associated protein|nr:hypothetical protein [Sphingomonadales bacterium]
MSHSAPTMAAAEQARCASRAAHGSDVGRPAARTAGRGNQANLRRLQAKLTVGAVNDPLEREADAAADQVMRKADARVSLAAPPRLSRKCESCEEEESGAPLKRKASGGGMAGEAAPAIVDRVLASPGRSLDPATSSFMGRRLGADFSDVRIHTDSDAAASATAVKARAYTVGRDLVFGSGEFEPNSRAGRHLLAHELAHVVQQSADSAPNLRRVADPSEAPASMPCRIATNSVLSLLDVHFDRDSATIRPAERTALEAFVASWHGQPGSLRLRIDGHASEEGTESHNWPLSCNRAMAVENVLTSPTGGGIAGIPGSLIEVVAQGETIAFGPARPDNRLATIWSDTPTPPPPAPEPAPTPAPAFRCGPNVTAEISAAVSRTRSTFAGWGAATREEHCDALDSLSTGGYAWDIVQLHNNDWIHLLYRPACATAGATPPCGSTVQVDSECSYAGSPNYVIFGTMCDLCHGHYVSTANSSGQSRFTQSKMLGLIAFYKGPGVFSSASGNYQESRLWASAGYLGWPSVASPAGDRPGCDPSCPTPHTAPSFQVAWWSNPGLFSSAVRTVI